MSDDDALIGEILKRGRPGALVRVSIFTQRRRDRTWWAVMTVNELEVLERGPFLNRDTAERARRKLDKSIDVTGIAERVGRENGATLHVDRTEEETTMGSPTIEQIQARQCAHVERGELEAVGLVRVHSLPGHTWRGESIDFTTAACAFCTGRAMGAMFASDCEQPGNRAAVDDVTGKLVTMLQIASLDRSHELALALIEVGWTMARELGRRPG